MNDSLAGITEALSIVAATWPCTPAGERLDLDVLSGSELVAVNNAMGALRRHVDAVHARVASEIAGQSRPEHGSEGLAKKNGYRNPALLIAATTGTTVGDASRLVAVGEATAPRRTFSGDAAPARHPHVATALSRGKIGTLAASAIITMLDRVALRSSPVAVDGAERILAEQAEGLAIDQLAKAIARAEAHLDPDGLEPKEHELRAQRSLHMFERDGVLNINVKLDPESGAPVKTAIQAIVTAEFRSEGRDVRERPRTAAGDGTDADAPHRTLPQRQADALVLLAAHALGCASNDLPIDGATAVVRMDLSDLESGTGVATVDGLDQPVSISTARRMAASGGVIPCVLGERSEILDWGRRKRLFTKAQKLALVERDGGCAMCGLPPGMTKVHHLRWWARDIGPTDLDNGVLLCETCHHRIHDNGWEIRIERVGADGPSVNDKVWFIPPVHVDPAQTPRLGGNARFSFTAA